MEERIEYGDETSHYASVEKKHRDRKENWQIYKRLDYLSMRKYI